MPSVFASTPAAVEISAAEAVRARDNAEARIRVMFDPPIFDVFVVDPKDSLPSGSTPIKMLRGIRGASRAMSEGVIITVMAISPGQGISILSSVRAK
jgi:hypothetical protein